MGHPAHFHLFNNITNNLKSSGHDVKILIKKKDILEELLISKKWYYQNILSEGRKDSKIGIFWGVLKRDFRLYKVCREYKPDILIGTSVENSHMTKLLKIPSINVNEDDANIVPYYAKFSYPWASVILNPESCNSGKWNNKAIKYNSFQELAYLHPNHFNPCYDIVAKYITSNKPYFIIRFAKLKAHHDVGIKGIDEKIAQKLIELLKPYGNIYITSERELKPEFKPYRITINPLDMHHVMAYAQIYIGDSQTMAAEAGVLGTPFIRFNDFVGRIGYLKELEEKYRLGYGVKPSKPENLYQKLNELLRMKDRQKVFQKRRKIMLKDKIDFAKFLTWFIENYPYSAKIMKSNPEYQYNFI